MLSAVHEPSWLDAPCVTRTTAWTPSVRGQASLNYQVMKANILAELDHPLERRRVNFKRDQASKKIGLVEQVKKYGLEN